STLLQKWFASLRHAHSSDPYFLYAFSNLGSMLALLSYPLLVEPNLTLADQSRLWSVGYIALVGLMIACGLAVWRAPAARAQGKQPPTLKEDVPGRQPFRWLALAFVPSSLMMSVTTYLTTDIAAIPLLWVVPLTVYLLTFILVFAHKPVLRHYWMVRGQPL